MRLRKTNESACVKLQIASSLQRTDSPSHGIFSLMNSLFSFISFFNQIFLEITRWFHRLMPKITSIKYNGFPMALTVCVSIKIMKSRELKRIQGDGRLWSFINYCGYRKEILTDEGTCGMNVKKRKDKENYRRTVHSIRIIIRF